jgi:hypothetical protein
MRKQLFSTVAIPALAFAAWAAMISNASADVFVTVAINKFKQITVDEFIQKEKFVFINVTSIHELDSAAESMAIVNATNTDNVVVGYDNLGVTAGNNIARDPEADFGIHLSAEVVDSFNDNTGIYGGNVDVGNMVNEGNIVAFALVGPEYVDENNFNDGSLAHSQAEIEQVNTNNEVFDSEFLVSDGNDGFIPNKTGLVNGSANNNTGIGGLNVNAGNMNNQHNVVSLSVGFDAVVALSEAALGQFNTGNQVTEIETVKVALVNNSQNDNSGINGLNLAVGNMINQAFVVSFSALTSNAVIGVPGS